MPAVEIQGCSEGDSRTVPRLLKIRGRLMRIVMAPTALSSGLSPEWLAHGWAFVCGVMVLSPAYVLSW